MAVLAAIVGYLTPLKFSGRALLMDELRQDGIPLGTIPESCITEIVAEAVHGARLLAKYQAREVHGVMMRRIQSKSSHIAEALMYRKPQWGGDRMSAYDRAQIVEVLTRHGVVVPQPQERRA